LCLATLGACGQPARSPDAGPEPGEADTQDSTNGPYRYGSSVVMGNSRVAWSLTQWPCALESGPECPPPLDMVMTSSTPAETPQAWVQTRRGVSLVGDENELFFVNQDDYLNQYIVRVRPAAPNDYPRAMNLPRPSIGGLVVDATHVYWCERGVNSAPLIVKRATRTGDGSDVETLATGYEFCPQFVFNGYLFAGVLRMPVTGGVPASFTSETNWSVIAVGADRLYVEQWLDPNGYRSRLGTLTFDGVFATLVPDLAQYDSPMQFTVLDRDELFWTTTANRFYRMPVTGGAPVLIGSLSAIEPFAVSADSILYGFTELGYKTMAR
jgi:hypothetical protein